MKIKVEVSDFDLNKIKIDDKLKEMERVIKENLSFDCWELFDIYKQELFKKNIENNKKLLDKIYKQGVKFGFELNKTDNNK